MCQSSNMIGRNARHDEEQRQSQQLNGRQADGPMIKLQVGDGFGESDVLFAYARMWLSLSNVVRVNHESSDTLTFRLTEVPVDFSGMGS